MTTDHFDHTAEVIADLTAAKEYLLAHGWCQGFQDSMSPHIEPTCMMGGINFATLGYVGSEYIGSYKEWDHLVEVLRDRRFRVMGALKAVLPPDPDYSGQPNVASWNDEPERQFNEVIAAFDAAIIRLKENHNGE